MQLTPYGGLGTYEESYQVVATPDSVVDVCCNWKWVGLAQLDNYVFHTIAKLYFIAVLGGVFLVTCTCIQDPNTLIT